MAELVPVPLPLLLRRAALEYRGEKKIFDLPANKIYRGIEGLDLSVSFHGHKAATPLGPAAGPHGQLAQNIALSWLGGSRIIELKTVQILDELEIPRPCIDAANVGYNVEWSQELKLEQSLREYVSAAMFLEILKASKLVGEGIPEETIFDMSVGYNLEGIQSPRVRGWIEAMRDARNIIDELRMTLTGEWARYKDLPFSNCISDTVSLSTFHGCPANEIEGIVSFLITELDCHVCIKLNPTLLGKSQVSHLLHDVMGYRDIKLHPPAFNNDLQFDEALHLIPRLRRVAERHGKSLSLKFTNTLVVKNHKSVLKGDLMYMSGAPLHVLAMNLVKQFRDALMAQELKAHCEDIPFSFSGGLDAHNIAAAVAMGFVPVTTCTDLLRSGGYARLIKYLENLGAAMRAAGATNISEYVAHYRGQRDVLVAEATANPRYTWERNKGVPRKIGSKLYLYDCINCDKCVPVCPNDANFIYETPARAIEYDNYQLRDGRIERIPGGVLRVVSAHQLANYADACNDCGNCDVFCPEDGGPNMEKPRFFSSLETYQKHAGKNGFFVEWKKADGCTIHGMIDGESYILDLNDDAGIARFERAGDEIEIRLKDDEPLRWQAKTPAPPQSLEMLPYLKLKLLAEAIGDPRHVHFANVAGIEETQQ